ncbi:MAG: hypothetical protein K6B74_10050, partial [Ruminococcus sp.]|nr:hypothetical protein [Ruminococcus sp.]
KPRNTLDIAKKLKPYLGEPFDKRRRCVFTPEENERQKLLTEQYTERLKSMLEERLADVRCGEEEVPAEPINGKMGKSALMKGFAGTGFEDSWQKGGLFGAGYIGHMDSHGYEYEISFGSGGKNDKIQNFISFYFFLKSYNFTLELGTGAVYVKSKAHANELIKRFAEFFTDVRDKLGAELEKDFGINYPL